MNMSKKHTINGLSHVATENYNTVYTSLKKKSNGFFSKKIIYKTASQE